MLISVLSVCSLNLVFSGFPFGFVAREHEVAQEIAPLLPNATQEQIKQTAHDLVQSELIPLPPEDDLVKDNEKIEEQPKEENKEITKEDL